MASYRFSASIVKRSAGRSSTAAAAYRAADRIEDERTGETADYQRRGGVVSAEIMAPEDAPDWCHDRAELWNAVEAAERRKDAQLARELQLSLPHELDDQQRRELVREFVGSEFVSRGMVADVAIHAPGKEGDDRNHHAHIMLTMRELDGDQFGKKAREWNNPATLQHWREQWAEHQNRRLERHGHEARVDHRSFEDRGIDREPQAHEGPHATAMKRKGKETRLAAENEATAERNTARTQRHVDHLKELGRIAAERSKFEDWARQKSGSLESAHTLARLDLKREQERNAAEFEDKLQADYGPSLRTMEHEAGQIADRLNAKGFRAAFRRVWSGKADREKLQQLGASIGDAYTRMQEARDRQAARDRADMARLKDLQEQRRTQQHEGIEKARERKEDGLAARLRRANERQAEQSAERQPEPQKSGNGLADRLKRARTTERKSEDTERTRQGQDRSNDNGREM